MRSRIILGNWNKIFPKPLEAKLVVFSEMHESCERNYLPGKISHVIVVDSILLSTISYSCLSSPPRGHLWEKPSGSTRLIICMNNIFTSSNNGIWKPRSQSIFKKSCHLNLTGYEPHTASLGQQEAGETKGEDRITTSDPAPASVQNSFSKAF